MFKPAVCSNIIYFEDNAVKAIAQELDIKAATLNKAIKIAHKASLNQSKEDFSAVEDVLEEPSAEESVEDVLEEPSVEDVVEEHSAEE